MNRATLEELQSFEIERQYNAQALKITIETRVPSKWRFVDRETGEVWVWLPGESFRLDRAATEGDLEKEFKTHAYTVAIETRHWSMPPDKHPSYQAIIAMGPQVIPLIFHDMIFFGRVSWFGALRELTGENPVPDRYRGMVNRMSEIWIEWGKEHKYL